MKYEEVLKDYQDILLTHKRRNGIYKEKMSSVDFNRICLLPEYVKETEKEKVISDKYYNLIMEEMDIPFDPPYDSSEMIDFMNFFIGLHEKIYGGQR